jgi:thiol-disulfide isomerase/thioredoxin
MQAAQRQAEQRRRLVLVGGSVLLVIVVVVAFIVIKGLNHPKQGGGTSGGLPTSVVDDITHVPASALSQVGTGALPDSSELPLKAISDTTLATVNGKPEMLYIGAEFCPYCAAMRWSMAVALSRFGTFGPLKGIHSSSTDVYPNTATLTFYRQQYTSSYLTFTPVENETVAEAPLQATTKQQQAVWAKYDTSDGSQSYPFIYFGGKVILTGPLYDPGVLKGLSWSQIASSLSDPSSVVAQNVLGAANYVTAAICAMTGDQPASVCRAGPIPSISSKI